MKLQDRLEIFELSTIGEYNYKEKIGCGQAGLTAIYENDDSEIVIKFLVVPRNDEEYQSFVSEYAALKKMKINIQDFLAVPKIKVDFNQYQNMPIYYFGMKYIEGITLKEFIKEKMALK